MCAVVRTCMRGCVHVHTPLMALFINCQLVGALVILACSQVGVGQPQLDGRASTCACPCMCSCVHVFMCEQQAFQVHRKPKVNPTEGPNVHNVMLLAFNNR